jgi:hypothetical protein
MKKSGRRLDAALLARLEAEAGLPECEDLPEWYYAVNGQPIFTRRGPIIERVFDPSRSLLWRPRFEEPHVAIDYDALKKAIRDGGRIIVFFDTFNEDVFVFSAKDIERCGRVFPTRQHGVQWAVPLTAARSVKKLLRQRKDPQKA